MPNPVLIIDGVDFTQHLPWDALKWSLNDLDSEDSGRNTRDGLMYREIIKRVRKLDISMKPMNEAEIKILIDVLAGKKYLPVTYLDPQLGEITRTLYNSERSATLHNIRKQTGPRWTDISFPLVER